ncbi:MAG: hypothetical protein ACFCBW_11785, partial [Candidatus Competibacterales bacterium]
MLKAQFVFAIGAAICGAGFLSPLVAASPAPLQIAQAGDSVDLERLIWEEIKASDDPSLLESYIANFPRGLFRAEAEARLEELQQAARRAAAEAATTPEPESEPSETVAGETPVAEPAPPEDELPLTLDDDPLLAPLLTDDGDIEDPLTTIPPTPVVPIEVDDAAIPAGDSGEGATLPPPPDTGGAVVATPQVVPDDTPDDTEDPRDPTAEVSPRSEPGPQDEASEAIATSFGGAEGAPDGEAGGEAMAPTPEALPSPVAEGSQEPVVVVPGDDVGSPEPAMDNPTVAETTLLDTPESGAADGADGADDADDAELDGPVVGIVTPPSGLDDLADDALEEPEVSPRDERDEARETQIAELLDKAEAALAANHLLTPAEDSVQRWATAVLELDPDNEQATGFLQDAVDRYLRWGRSNLDRGSLARAAVFASRARTLSDYATQRQLQSINQLERQIRVAEVNRRRAEEEAAAAAAAAAAA